MRQGGIFNYKRQFDPFNKWHWMFLAVRQGSNKGSSQIDPRDREFSASKWVTMGTVKAELCKIANILKKDLHWLTRVG